MINTFEGKYNDLWEWRPLYVYACKSNTEGNYANQEMGGGEFISVEFPTDKESGIERICGKLDLRDNIVKIALLHSNLNDFDLVVGQSRVGR